MQLDPRLVGSLLAAAGPFQISNTANIPATVYGNTTANYVNAASLR